MDILAHRGFWHQKNEQNTLEAIEKAFAHGYGLETDLRDFLNQVIISHDCPKTEGLPTLKQVLDLYQKYDQAGPLALNVKADGLQDLCLSIFKESASDLKNIFFFDMSIPDGLVYLKKGLPCFTRYSDEEVQPAFEDRACGIWLDGFNIDCIDESVFQRFFNADLPICLVSPELHGRPYQDIWPVWRSFFEKAGKSGMICTDFPDKADSFFNG